MSGIYRRKRDFPEQRMGEDLMIFDPETDKVHVLNTTSTLIWECLKAELDAGGIERRLRETFSLEGVQDVGEVIKNSLRQFEAKGLIEPV